MAVTIASPHSIPGITSLGAIQQRILCRSRAAHTASAVGLSRFEWLMNTSCAMSVILKTFGLYQPLTLCFFPKDVTKLESIAVSGRQGLQLLGKKQKG